MWYLRGLTGALINASAFSSPFGAKKSVSLLKYYIQTIFNLVEKEAKQWQNELEPLAKILRKKLDLQ